MRFILLLLLLSSQSLSAQVNLNEGLICYYPFNGNANDESGNNINGKVFNTSLIPDRNGTPNSACYFNGKNSYILLPYSNLYNFPEYGSFSISLWILPDPGNTWPAQALVVKAPGSYDFNLSQWNYGTYILDYKAMGGYAYEHILNGSTLFTYRQCWHNIVTTYNNGKWRLYVNGKLESSDLSKTKFILQNKCKIALGKKGEADGDWYKGKMDEVRIYNRELNFSEIKAISNNCGFYDCILNKPSAKFSYSIKNCTEVGFRLKEKNKEFKSVRWLFGDGSTSTELSPAHTYKKYGGYKIKVIVTNKAGCSDTVTNEINLQELKTDFVFTEQGDPGQIQFKAKNNKASYSWDFADGNNKENETVVAHTYKATGKYPVIMFARNNIGCTDTISKNVTVLLPAVISDSLVNPNTTAEIQEVISPAITQLETREKELVENITVDSDSLIISVYDNGIIDGDSVTLIYNSKIIATHQLLGSKPLNFSIKLDKSISRNELMMYAENLGSIPPNTSLMIIYDGSTRHQLNISSSKKSNGTVSFTLRNRTNL
jgi:PKD repeat protein